jgi:FkbM family methyltransferase
VTGVGDRRDLLLAALPHGLVEGVRGRRMLRRLGAAGTGAHAVALAREARLDLLPPQALRAIETAIDVGANEGRWSVAVATLARPATLIAVEPSPSMLPRLRTTVGSLKGAHVVGSAVGDAIGETTLNVTSHSHNASLARPRTREMDLLYGGGYDVVERVRVPLTTLDELTRDLREVSLLKIDVQGFERAVLEGAAQTLEKTRWLLIEANFSSHYEGDILFPELHARITAAGFVLTGLSPPFIRSGVALWCDALYEHERR